MPTVSAVPTLLTVQQFCEKHRAFTPGGLRWLLFHRHTNGLEQAVVRLGRRLLLDEAAFFVWLQAQDQEEHRGQR